MYSFDATIQIIGINPFVSVPAPILQSLLSDCSKIKGNIPIKGTISSKPYQQTLVKYLGEYRLYINTTMLKDSPKHVGKTISLTVEVDNSDRRIAMHPKLQQALHANPRAQACYNSLSQSKKHEIVRYIAALKTDASVDNNVTRAIQFLLGNGRFVGRDKP